MRYFTALLLLFFFALMVVSCSKKKPPTNGYSPINRLEIVSGNNQVAKAYSDLGQPLEVRLTTADGFPVGGDSVFFWQISSQEGGHIIFPIRETDTGGYTRTYYRTDTVVGVDTIMALAPGAEDSVVYFELTVIPGDAHSLRKVSGDLQSTVAGEPLPDPIVVRVVDQYGNSVSGHKVSFKAHDRCLVETDSSALLPFETDSVITRTDDSGLATAIWIMTVNPLDPFFPYPNSSTLRPIALLGDSLIFNASTTAPGVFEYYNDVRSILADNCFACHPGMSDYRLDFYYEVVSDSFVIAGDSTSPFLSYANAFHKANNINVIEEDKIFRWIVTDSASPGSSGLNNYTDNMKSIFDNACISCHGGPLPQSLYSLESFQGLRGNGSDLTTSNAIPGDTSSLLVGKMDQRHQWTNLDSDSVMAAMLADSIIKWIVNDSLRQY